MLTNSLRRAAALLLAAALSFTPVLAGDAPTPKAVGTAQYLLAAVPKPQVGSSGGEWAILGLARNGCDIPTAYLQAYLTAAEQTVIDCGGQLHESKYTEYSRVILALSALGKDARAFAGYDLTLPLGDYDKTVWQGVNGAIWALLALDSAGYPMPQNPQATTQATRQAYVNYLLACQLPDGGWSLSGDGTADPDVTAMTLQALAKYEAQPEVATVIRQGLDCLSLMQDGDGGYSSWGVTNAESVAQVLVALTELGISPSDPRFVKNHLTVVDNLLAHRQEDGSFRHSGSGSNLMATEQGLYALAALGRVQTGKPSLYRMEDALSIPDATDPLRGMGLSGKHADVTPTLPSGQTPSFPDLAGQTAAPAVTALAQRGIITGKSSGFFEPNASMTRAEYATIVVKALGLPQKEAGQFTDVAAIDWYAQSVATAYGYGIVTGTGQGLTFLPWGTITRQEAAVMTARAAALCGLDVEMNPIATKDVLAQFPDYVTAAQWARPALAFCYDNKFLDPSVLTIQPLQPITRGEVAQMLFRLLEDANLL